MPGRVTALDEELERIVECDAARLRSVGEAARDEAERLARSGPHRLGPLLRALRATAGKDRRFLPWALWAEGTAEHFRGRPAVAEPLFRRSGRLFRVRGDHHTAARVDILMMDVLACLGRHRAASRRGRRALSTFTDADDRARVASALINLGGLADARDQVRSAVALWRRAERLVEPGDVARSAAIRGSLAGALQASGRCLEAATLYGEVETLLERHGIHATALKAALGRAEVSALLGDVGHAMAEISRVQRAAAELEDDNLVFEAAVQMAGLELRLGQLDRVVVIADEMAPRCARSGRRDDAARLEALRAVAVARGAQGDVEAAVARAEQALRRAGLRVAAATMRVDLARAGTDVSARQLARDAAALARSGLKVQADLARLVVAEAMLAEGQGTGARRACEQVLGHRHASVWPRMEAHRVMAEIDADSEPSSAIRHLGHAVRIAESVRGRLASEADRAAFTARATSSYERLVGLLLERSDARSRRRAFDLVARLKSRTLIEALDRKRDLEWRDHPELVRQWNVVRQELAGMLASLENRSDQQSRYATTPVEERIRCIAREVEALELEIERASPGLAAALGRVSAPALGPLLGPHEAYVEAFFSGPDLILFHLDRGGLRALIQRDVRAEVEEEVAAIRFQLAKGAYGRVHLEAVSAFLVGRLRSRLARLGERLFATLAERRAPGCVYFAPHGVLHHLPVAALELGGEPLVESCAVAVVPGSAVLARILGAQVRRPEHLGVAGAATADLPQIEREVDAIAHLFPAAATRSRAAVADVLELLGRCDVVHIASHGAFQSLFPAGSGIRLQDGWLTALDLLQSPITARLVTLGVCAAGEVAVAPGEELVGVVRALLASGVRSAVLAPGALDDRIGRDAAQLFYQTVFEVGPGEALRQAQRQLRQEHPHPALWAALQLHGNPRPWEDA